MKHEQTLPGSLTVRLITAEEAEDCAALIRKSFLPIAEKWGLTKENAPRYTAFAITGETLRQRIADPRRPVYACLDGQGRMAGCYGLTDLGGGACEMNHLCVLPTLRHRGVGEMLLNDALRRAREMDFSRMHIGIVEENKELKTWYEGFGFVPTGAEKYVFFPFTCGFMEKRLD